ncbi:hypothetical protein CLA01_14290 [Chryseobacterium lathyri]|jgi:hypothetical protein|uniref:Uncharacterized protein n=1 Tax=Chryseobacterium lathyri TaxID=395933 RepID=A0A511Y828_9FLAO|nr:hypothetical protein CLA01_14290 [Chryseobacterium lathyri]
MLKLIAEKGIRRVQLLVLGNSSWFTVKRKNSSDITEFEKNILPDTKTGIRISQSFMADGFLNSLKRREGILILN